MSSATRYFLLITAALCAAFITIAGAGFAAMSEPAKTDVWTYVFWTLIALVLTAPLWLPALVSTRHPLFFRICRWLGALGLVPPILLFSKMASEQPRLGVGSLLTSTVSMATLVLLACCLTSWVLLLRPELMWIASRLRR